MQSFPKIAAALLAVLLIAYPALADENPAADEALPLFAVEIRVGPNWDASKSPGEQAYFRDHSAHLRRLRDAGHIVMGARYSDVGLLVFSAESADAVDAMMREDPSMIAGTFRYAVHSMNAFYPWRSPAKGSQTVR
jgi:uncharacterized protein YciI